MVSADRIFQEAAARGLRLNNLFQFGDIGTWRANWRDDSGGHPFGEADTPQRALALALAAVPPVQGDLFGDLLGCSTRS